MGMLMSIPLLIVARLMFGENPGLGLYESSRDILPWLLLIISIFLIMTETTRLAWLIGCAGDEEIQNSSPNHI